MTSTRRSPGSASTAQSWKASKWSSTKTRIGSATSADRKDCSSGWPKNSAESPRLHVDRGWTSRGHGRKRVDPYIRQFLLMAHIPHKFCRILKEVLPLVALAIHMD